MAWKVPAQVRPPARIAACGPSTSAAIRSARRVISAAARREKVMSRMRRGSAPVSDQVGDAVRERVGLAGAGAGDDQERPGDAAVAVQHRGPLLGIEALEWVGGRGRRIDQGHGAS